MAKTYRLDLTGGQLRVLNDVLLMVMNDSDWQEMASCTDREWAMLGRASDKIMDAWRAAAKAESTPAFPSSEQEPS